MSKTEVLELLPASQRDIFWMGMGVNIAMTVISKVCPSCVGDETNTKLLLELQRAHERFKRLLEGTQVDEGSETDGAPPSPAP